MAKLGPKVEGKLLERLQVVQTHLFNAGVRAGKKAGELARQAIALQAIEEWIARMERNLGDPSWAPSLSSENNYAREIEGALLSLGVEARSLIFPIILDIIRASGRPNGLSSIIAPIRAIVGSAEDATTRRRMRTGKVSADVRAIDGKSHD